MKTATKTALCIAAGLIILGLFISVIAAALMGFSFAKFSPGNYVSITQEVTEPFSSIYIDEDSCSIQLLPSHDEVCRIACTNSDQDFHSFSVENGTLHITSTDTRKWYMHIISFMPHSQSLTLYLPQSEYESLAIRSTSGSIEIPADFAFVSAELESTSGSLRFLGSAEESLFLSSTSGRLYAENAAPKYMEAECTSGRIELANIRCQNLSVENTSGRIALQNVLAAESIRVENTSGGISLEDCDAESIWLDSVSGSISGTLLSDKIFDIDTVSGSVHVPQSVSGGTCRAHTISGSIRFSIQ